MQRAGSAHGPQPLHKQDGLGWKLRGAGAHQLFHQPMPNAGTPTLAALHHPKGRGEAGEASLAQTKPSRSSISPQPPSSTGLAPSADIWVAQGRLSSHSPHQSGAAEVGACPSTKVSVLILLPDPSLPAPSSASAPAIAFHDGAPGMGSLPAAHSWH